MERFQGKYRISSTRLRNWDYASQGMYFVTLCTKNREHYFGQIIKPESEDSHFKMHLSEIGKKVETEWLKTPKVRPDMNLTFGEYQVMPNHFHAILIIGENEYNAIAINHEMGENSVDPYRDAMLASLIDSKSDNESINKSDSDSDNPSIFELEMQMILETHTKSKNEFAPQSKNLGSIMRGFKSSVTKFAMDNNIAFNWQPRYYDHIIRNYNEYERIENYIRNNPANWGNDRLR
jgi:REP element-mobilizing transposase RayT